MFPADSSAEACSGQEPGRKPALKEITIIFFSFFIVN
jgi:hypothetical protein